MTITPTHIEQYFRGFAAALADAPHVAHLTALAVTATTIPASLLADLAGKFARLDQGVIASVLAVRAREIANDGLTYDDAADFVRTLDAELLTYISEPEVTAAALAEVERRERGTVH